MQYGVTGAVSNTSANLLVLALPAQPDMTPSATDFTVQLAQSSQLGTVSLLPNQVSGTDFLVQVRHQVNVPAKSCGLALGIKM